MALFKHGFHLLHGFESVWHDLPMKFALQSQKNLWVIGSNLQMPWFEQFIKHEFKALLDWRMLNKACESACVKLFKFAKDKIDVKSIGSDVVEESTVA